MTSRRLRKMARETNWLIQLAEARGALRPIEHTPGEPGLRIGSLVEQENGEFVLWPDAARWSPELDQ